MARGRHLPSEATGTPDENFSIAIPPPNVTGELHMGHALNDTLQDILTRKRRMEGRQALWALGTDHAGIATQVVVERQLVREGTSREELGREEFERRVWEWREQYGSKIIEQYKRLGASCDYERERFTMDEGYVRAVYEGLQGALRQGLHLPRQLHGELGPWLGDRDLRPGGGVPRGGGHPLFHRLPARVTGRET